MIALQYWQGDEAEAMRLARLLSDIEPKRRDDVLVAFCRRSDTPQTRLSWDTQLHCGLKFGTMAIQSQRDGTGHPAGANELWAGTMDQLSGAWWAGRLPTHSVFTIEADGCPLRADWLDILIDEHRRAIEEGKRVTGCYMRAGFPHINGTLMAHFSLWQDRPSLRRTPSDQAWDLFHAAVLTSEARPTSWIKNVYGLAEWSDESLRALARETAWLSSTKDATAIGWAERALVAGRALGTEEPTPAAPRRRVTVRG